MYLFLKERFSMTHLLEIINNEPRVSALVIANSTDNKYTSINNLLRTYRKDIEEFGKVLTYDLKSQVGKQSKTVTMLNEQQATFLMTLLKNSKQVVEFKKNLVKAFFKLREAQQTSTSFPPASSTFTKYDFTLVIFYLFGRAMITKAIPNLKLSSAEELTTKYNESLFRRTALTKNEIITLVIEKLLEEKFLHLDEEGKILTNFTYGQVLEQLQLHSYGAELQLIMNRPLSELPTVQNPTALQSMVNDNQPTEKAKAPETYKGQETNAVVYVDMVFDAIDMMEKHGVTARTIKTLISTQQF
ncbi:MAG: Unknown protein [uncultured Sulfurovum sp.]|uniref:Uncharacterized protein n=1 Tax=uncultured Sulfurovum sp. TaxID=269237 RepID=A0A6S6SVB6_9BACT|nr:MAG: Unknown protein [uncultured Sulfurovum sp.]